MRLGYLIRRIDLWFIRVVYERDSWDLAFQEWADSVDDWRLGLIVFCAHAAVWCSRRILAVLLVIGHAVSCFLSRQMEYHADACASSVAGSAGTESMLLRLREQAVLHQVAMNGLSQIWKQRHKLPENLPDYLRELESRAPADFHEQARQTMLNETAPWFTTHPTPAQRIRQARQQAVEGIFTLEKPARLLFGDFERTAKAVTARYYLQDLRLAVTNPMLRPVGEFFAAPVRG
jgi:hypothetical protein